MLIPNLVAGNGQLTLAVPSPSYWCSTSAEYYVNIPGYDTDVACVWGDSGAPVGNWAPFVAGANQASNGMTFIMAGINPIYCCEVNDFEGKDPGYAIRIDCPSGNCNGMPCECNPSTMGPNKCSGGTVGAGGAEFCTVTVPSGGSANLVIFSTTNNTVISTSAISSSGAAPAVAPAPAAAPAPEPAAPAPAPPSSSAPKNNAKSPPPASSSDCTKSTSSSWTSNTASAVAAPAYGQYAPSSGESGEIQISPSGAGFNQQNQGLTANNGTSSNSTYSSSASSPTLQSSPIVQVTSGADRAIHTSTLLCLMCLIALGMVNL